jgi:hypothetical protein
LKFSELNTDIIYFSGSFPQTNSSIVSHNGLFKYSIQENKIIDSTFGVGVNRVYEGYFTLFDNENRIFYVGNGKNIVLNYLSPPRIEFSRNIEYQGAGAWFKILYSIPKNIFIGFADKYYSMGIYNNEVGVEDLPLIIQTLYPNPTNGEINIKINCQNINQSYSVCDINGTTILPIQQISAGQSSLTIDFSQYPSGAYFLKIYCGNNLSTYKIIKEG